MAFNIHKHIRFCIAFSIIFVGAVKVFAAGNDTATYTLLAPIPCIQGYQNQNGVMVQVPPNCKNNSSNVELKTQISMGDYFQYAFNLLIALAAVAAVFMIVWGGFEYVTSASFQTKSDGKKKFMNAIIGLAMILCSYIVLKAVNPNW